jgi:hypothetical protein
LNFWMTWVVKHLSAYIQFPVFQLIVNAFFIYVSFTLKAISFLEHSSIYHLSLLQISVRHCHLATLKNLTKLFQLFSTFHNSSLIGVDMVPGNITI